MAYSIDQDEGILGIINKIAAEPINESQYTAVRNPKPIVESISVFDDVKVDFSKWTTDSKKVNKAKTVDTGSAKQVTENDTVEEKKDGGKVTEIVSDTAEHEAKDEPKAKTGSFDTAAKNAASSNRSSADARKKFEENCKKQRNNAIEFKSFVESLVVDAESREAADKIIARFEAEFEKDMAEQKAQFEGTSVQNKGQYVSMVYDYVKRHSGFDDERLAKQSAFKAEDAGLDVGTISDMFDEGLSVKQAGQRIIGNIKRGYQSDWKEAFGNDNVKMPTNNSLKRTAGGLH